MRRSRRSVRSFLLSVALLLFVLWSQSALALDKDDLLRLHEAGLSADVIVNVIRGTTEPLDISAEDVAELEAVGMPEPVINELRLRLGLTETEPSGETPTLQRELEEQRRLEAERRRIEEERMAAERERARQQLEAERSREAMVQTGYSSLRQAGDLYDSGNYLEAAALYNRFLEEVAPDPLSDEYYEAKFGLVRALHAAGVRSGIRVDALEVALMGAERRHFADAVRILRDVVNDGGFNSPRIADLANEVLNDYGIDFRDEFNYFMGRYFYEAGELTQALRFLTEVSPTGEFGARALFLSAVVLVNPEMGENIRAVQNLEAAITHADPDSETDQEVVENAYLALARIAYQVGNFGGALYYYHQIPSESPRWTTALFESAWTYFLAGDLNRAVGNFHSLHSPYHNHRFYPDLWVLEAAAYLYSCNIDEARAAVNTFDEEVAVLRDVLREFVAEATDPMVYYRVVYEPTRSREIGDPALPEEAIDTVLADIDLRNQHEIIQQLDREIAIFRAAGDSLGERGETTLELLETELGNRRLEAAVVVHDVVDDLIRELDDWWFKAQEVRIEIGDLETQYLQAILAEGESAITEGTTFFVVADDWQFWPWEGEYWLDEVGNYRGNLTTRCPDVVEF